MRLMASKASVKDSLTFLTELGFQGLSLKANMDEMIKFWYKDYDKKVLEKHLGKPKATDSNIKYDMGTKGVVSIWPNNKTVVLKNAKTQGPAVKEPKITEPKIEKIQPDVKDVPLQTPNTPGSKENDDSKVPVTHISADLEREYASIRGIKSPMAQMHFLKKLWHYLNQSKFGGKMTEPNFRLLKTQSAQSMRLRGRWWPSKRLLEVSPRLYNATQNFFVEIVLHEACHQAVSEIDKSRDYEKQGHGPQWTKWMRHVGLNPSRFDPNDNTVYMTPQELKQEEEKKAARQVIIDKTKQMVQEKGLKPIWPEPNKFATILREGKEYHGILAGRWKHKGREVWSFIPEENLERFRTTKTLAWLNTWPNVIYEYQGTNQALLSTSLAKEATAMARDTNKSK